MLTKKSGVALCALATMSVTPALAQTATQMGASEIEEVVVMGRKREEALQDVPLSISAISGDTLEREANNDVTALVAQVPGLFVAPGSVSATTDLTYLTMRGVGFNAGLEPAVGVFIDGMYQPQIGFDLAFLNVERVEVLRGPQGTLFGRNTQGGAVNIITRQPGNEWGGRASIDVAELGTLTAHATVDGPLTSSLSGALSAAYARTDGFIHNDILDQNQDESEMSAIRASLHWTPTNDWAVMLIADGSQRDYNEVVRGVRLSGDHSLSLIDQDAPDAKANHGVQINITHDLSDTLTFTAITGYRYSNSDNLLDMDSRITPRNAVTLPSFEPLTSSPVTVSGASLAAQVDQTFISQELRLAGETDYLNWLVGAYYFTQEQNQDRQREVGRGVAPSLPAALYIYEEYRDDRDGYAAFGQASYRPFEHLELTLGARYSEETVDGSGLRVSVFGPPVNRIAPLVREAEDTFHNLSWMGSAAYDLSNGVTAYFTYAQGWKAGGVERYPGRVNNLVFGDESSENYEVGLKSTLFNRRLILNLAAYHIDMENQQLTNVIPDPGGGPAPISVIENAAQSHVDGAEVEFTWRTTDALTISGAYSYSDGVFDEFVRRFSPADTFDMAGTPFENVPKSTAYLNVNYSVEIGEGRTLDFAGNYRYVDEIIFQDNTRASTSRDQLTTPAYDRINLSIGLNLDDSLRLSGYVLNALDSFDYSYISSDPFIGGDVFVIPLAPRQFGLRLSKSF